MAASDVGDDDVTARRRGVTEHQPAEDLERVLAGAVAHERGARSVRVPAVVLDADLEVGVREVEAIRSAVDDDAVLLDRARKPRARDPAHELGLHRRLTRVEAGQPRFEDRPHDSAATPAAVREIEEDDLESAKRHVLATQRFVDRLLDAARVASTR